VKLDHEHHDRDAAGLTLVYPVVSRRSGGVSIGVNLTPDKACNWRCSYCQVPGLVRGKPAPIDLVQLERELRALLTDVLTGDFLVRHVPEDLRRLNDVAFSGDGEPTASPQFGAAVELLDTLLEELDPGGSTKRVLITNGSLVHQTAVSAGLARLGTHGEVWFKLDRATDEGMRTVNDVAPGLDRVGRNLETCARLVPTWIQTAWFARAGQDPSTAEQDALIAFLKERVDAGIPLRGILLYGLARPSHQPEARELERLPVERLEAFAGRLRATGLEVRVFP
jgi:wyosine [tRNA(Phe)-imidazoG37] synthetase (radical SAM superfamily)